MRRRFFVDEFAGDRAVMEGEAAHHLAHVLRAQPGQLYELSDGHRVCLARIETVKRERVEFSLTEELPAHESKIRITLLLSIVKFDAFEWALEKATELGVDTIVPLAAARSEKALLVAAPKRAERWKKIVLESSRQSRRVSLPVLAPLAKAEKAFASNNDDKPLRIMLSERPSAPSLRAALERRAGWKPALQNGDPNSPQQTRALQEGRHATTAVLAIGPEGGWTDAEFQAAQRSGFQEASLGSMILRTETAVIAAIASLNYALSDE